MSHPLRPQYRELSDTEKQHIETIKALGVAFYDYVTHSIANTRETALSRTKIEEAVMWAVKSVTK